MLVAYIWHFWIGLLLTLAAVATVVSLVAGYLKKVTALRYPSGKHREE
jgi:hypothetical protein